ncbi:hypothetical protein RQP46_001560 [Phenoliferia psychrophenolica]
MSVASSLVAGGGGRPSASNAAAAPALALASPAPSAVVTLPLEIIIEVILILSLPRDESNRRADDLDRAREGWAERHAELRAASLVSREWRAIAQSLLYGRLELEWEAGTAAKLLRTIEENPGLCGLVKSVSTIFIAFGDKGVETGTSSELDYAWIPRERQEGWILRERQEGSDALWYFIARLPNLRILSMAAMDMPISDLILESLAPVLAQLTEVCLDGYYEYPQYDHALSIFHLLHSVKIVRLPNTIRNDERPSKQPRRRAQHSGQLKFMSVHGQDIAVLGLDYTNLVRLDIECIIDEELFDLSREFFPSLVNLKLLFISTSDGRFTDEAFESFCISLKNTKLTELYFDNWPTVHHLHLLPPTIKVLAVDCSTLERWDAPIALQQLPDWKPKYLPNLEELVVTSLGIFTPYYTSITGTPLASHYTYYIARARLDVLVRSKIHTLARTTHGRLAPIQEIRAHGENVVNVLEELKETSSEAEPEFWLSVRHWATEALEAIKRDRAVAVWNRIAEEGVRGEESESSFEDGVLAFVAYRGDDPEQVRRKLDDMVVDIVPLCHNTHTSAHAALLHIIKTVSSSMRSLGFQPADEQEYHNLNNHFLSSVLADAASPTPRRGTLPLSLVAIFCALIRRLPHSMNVKAEPIAFPGKVLACLSHREPSRDDPIYVDVFGGGKVVTLGELRATLDAMGVPMEPGFLQPASAKDMCERVARNILHSVRTRQPEGTPSALYATARAFFTFAPRPVTAYAGWLSTLIQSPEFSMDVDFLETEELRRELGSDARREEVSTMVQSIREDDEPPEPAETNSDIIWKPGHVFIHRLFGYVAVIRGFDVTCKASEQWIIQMQVDSLPHGRSQPFYQVVTAENHRLYVASENITTAPVPAAQYEAIAKTPNMSPPEHEVRIAIIGAGISGMILAIELKKRLNIDTFTIYERMADVGGTWRDNYYPGCACDVPSHWYSLSTELNADWTHKFSSQPEIQRYWKGVYEKHNLAANTQLDSTFVKAVWNAENQTYTCDFRTSAGKEFTIECDVLVSAIGGFSSPLDKPVGMKGLDLFKGPTFHSARWNNEVDLAGKRVGVIGNGCSATQFIPIITKDKTTDVLNFCRTPSWFAPRPQKAYSSVTKAAFRYVPGLMRSYRNFIAITSDSRYIIWKLNMAPIRHFAEEVMWSYMAKSAPKKYHAFLRPTYPLGCKRIIMDPGYLAVSLKITSLSGLCTKHSGLWLTLEASQALHRSNLDLVTEPIETVTANGIRTADGVEHELDVLILATGFNLSEEVYGLNVVGNHGKTIGQQWHEQGGPQAYLGTTLSGFPNVYTLLGPNVASGSASVVYSSEAQVNHVINMIEPMSKYGVKSWEAKMDAEKVYNLEIQEALSKTVWNGGCNSYYKLGNKVVATYPGPTTSFWWRTRVPVWENYIQTGGSRLIAVRYRLNQALRIAALIALVVFVRRVGIKTIKRELIFFLLMRYQDLMGLVESIRGE